MTQFVPNSLPIYASYLPQIHRLHWCNEVVGGKAWKHVTPLNAIPPFVYKTNPANGLTDLLLVPIDLPGEQIPILDLVNLADFDTGTDGNKWVSYSGATTITTSTVVEPGDYFPGVPILTGAEPTYAEFVDLHKAQGFYLALRVGSNWLYSADFFIEDVVTGDPSTVCNHIVLEWTDSGCEVGDLRHDLVDITSRLYLPAETIEPEYDYDDDGQEDSHNEYFPTWQKSKKRYKIVVLAPEYIADALALLPLHDTVSLTDQFGDGYQFDGNLTEVSIEWERACLARCTILMGYEYITKSCCPA